ncbi:ABC transporter permease [Gemmatimonadota bacterium]
MVNLRLAFRTLTRTPFVTAIAILSLALGIGANAAIYSLFDEMLIRPLPVREPHRLVNLGAPGPKPGSQSCNQAGDCEEVFSYPMFRDLERADAGFSGVAAHRQFGANLAHSSQTMSGEGMLVSGSYFPLLGLQPALGRLIAPADDQNIGGHYVVVLSHDYWESRLGADPGVVNETLVVNGQPMTIVGVAPRGFTGTTLGSRPAVFVPITMRGIMEPGWDRFENRRSYWAYLFARLEPGLTLEQARAGANAVYQGIVNEVEAPLQEGMSDQTMEQFRAKQITVVEGWRGQSSIHSLAKVPILMLFAITGVVLLIACANIANLLLARGAHRAPEMAIRGSLGASRTQLLKQLLLESCLLALTGGLASLLVASWTLGFIGSLLPAEAVETITIGLSPTAMLFAGALSLGTGLLFGLYPAFHSTRPDLVSILKANSGQPSGARSAARFRTALVTSQIALSMALLVAAGLFLKSLVNVSRIDLGLRADNVVTLGVSPELNGYEPEPSMALFESMEEELAAIPGVTGVTASMIPILSGSNWGTDVSVEGFESGPDTDANARLNRIGADYFSTLGIPLLGGREFSPADALGAPSVAIINETFAEKFGLDPREAVGKRMSLSRQGELDVEIIGVVQDAKYSEVRQVMQPLFFTPYRQDASLGFLTFYLRTGMDPGSVIRAVPEVVRGLDPNLPVERLKTLEDQVRESVFMDRMISTLSTAFAVLATLLAAVGLYGVLAFTVAQRTREIGLRMALGAEERRVRGMVLKQVGLMTLVGGAVGIAGALALSRGAQSLLFEMEGTDPWVVALSAVLLALVALGAGYAPALRASRVDPMQALRYE